MVQLYSFIGDCNLQLCFVSAFHLTKCWSHWTRRVTTVLPLPLLARERARDQSMRSTDTRDKHQRHPTEVM